MTSLIVPAFNPGPDVDRSWHAVADFLADRAQYGDSWDAVFVLDGCTDGTSERLAWLARVRPAPVQVVGYAKNRGKGHALREGLLAARGAYRIFTDVDLAYSFDDVMRVSEALRGGAAVAIASREHPASRLLLPGPLLGSAYRRRIQSRMFGTVARTLLPLAQADTQAGLKGMTAAVAERLVPELRCDGFGFDCEFLTACARTGIAVTEVPVSVRYESRASTTGLRSGLKMLWELWRIRRRWRNRTLPAPDTATAPMSRAA
jgi:glycosyltransferase involved in cell wall biosynthesis